MLINEYFTDQELACRCGCGKLPNYKTVEKLYILRILWNRPMIINSAARCEAYHINIYLERGFEPEDIPMESYHLKGDAIDIAMEDEHKAGFIKLAQECGFRGIGVYSWGVHIDPRPYAVRWEG